MFTAFVSKDAREAELTSGDLTIFMLSDSEEARKKANIISVFLIHTNFSLVFNTLALTL